MSMSRILAAGLLGLAVSVYIGGGALRAEGEGTAKQDAHAAHGAEGHAGDGHGSDAHGGHGGEHEAPSPLKVDFDLAIFTVLIFVLLLVVLGKFAWGPIASALDLRERKISDNIAAAEQLNQEAKRLLGEYEAKLSAAREEVRGILDEARRDAEHAGQEIVAKARTDAQAETQRGKVEIETATAQALNELARSSANLAVDLAGRIVGAKLTAGDHAKLIEDALATFPQGDHRQN
jgi:F-type H+-transporting ATPase subunit b